MSWQKVSELLQDGLALHQAGKLQEAKNIYEAILREQPEHPDALHLLGYIAYQVGDNETAINLIEKAIQVNADAPDYYYNCARAYRALEQNYPAIDLYEKALALKPDFIEAHNNIGNALKDVGKKQEAIAHYLQALDSKPDYVEAHNNLGIIYMEVGQRENARIHFEQAILIMPDDAETHLNLGVVLSDLGRTEEAIVHYQHALDIKPDYAQAYNNMGNALQKQDKPEEALVNFEQALVIKPDYAEVCNNMGNVLQGLERSEEALARYEQALTFKPDYAEAYINMGNVFQELGRLDRAGLQEALNRYDKAIAINPDNVEAYKGIGNTLMLMGRQAEAIVYYDQALAIKPDDAVTYNSRGTAYKELGKLKDAIASYERALTISPDFAKAHHNLSLIKPNFNSVPVIEQLLTVSGLPDEDAMHYHYALGNLHNSNDSYATAFEHFLKANSIMCKSTTYDADNYTENVGRLISGYSKQYFQDLSVFGSDSQLPVFILGMPRSGTTLVEQIISSHPQIHGAGELVSFTRFEKEIAEQFISSHSYPDYLFQLDSTMASKFIDMYLTELDEYSQSAIYITDKFPGNYNRIGLIKTLFPNARIIHCNRNAIDTCTSIFSLYFPFGNTYSYDLVNLARHYVEYERLMAHWSNLFPNEIFDVQYEDMVMNQEAVSRQIIEHLGLEWDNKCLEFEKNDRAVRTASNLQVRKPIYNSSINRWKRYESQLGPLLEILGHHA